MVYINKSLDRFEGFPDFLGMSLLKFFLRFTFMKKRVDKEFMDSLCEL